MEKVIEKAIRKELKKGNCWGQDWKKCPDTQKFPGPIGKMLGALNGKLRNHASIVDHPQARPPLPPLFAHKRALLLSQ